MKMALLVCVGLAVGALSWRGAHAQTIVKIGHVGPLTGAIANLGKDNERGATLAVEEINSEHLIIGGESIVFQLDSQDDAADPRTATQVAQRLVDDGVVAVVGHMTSGTTIPASKIYSDAGMVEISPSATNPAYTEQGFKTTYRLVATDAALGPALAGYAQKNLGIKTVAIVDDSTAYGQGLANQFEKRAKSLGLTIVSHDASSDKAIDFRAILTKIKGSHPDAIMYGGMEATGAPFVKQAKQLGLSSVVLSGDGVCVDDFPKLAGEASDSVVCAEAGMPLSNMARGPEFSRRFEARFSQPILLYAPSTYDAVYVIVDAMKRANSTERAKILSAMPATNYSGVSGNLSFDSKGDLNNSTITLFRFKGGSKVPLSVARS